MLETIRAWLNGSREYYTGVAIYAQVGDNEDLLEVLKKGPNDFRIKRLQEELLDICNELKKENEEELLSKPIIKTPVLVGYGTTNCGTTKEPATEPFSDLYKACKLEADQLYKKVMNDRAILFKLTECETWENPNLPHKIEDRVKLALDVVHGHQLVSQLYDKAEHVKLHGRLPSNGDDKEENEYDHLPDHLVKQRLDNLRKTYNKLKKKEATPERLQLLQQHESNIQKLETKWRSL